MVYALVSMVFCIVNNIGLDLKIHEWFFLSGLGKVEVRFIILIHSFTLKPGEIEPVPVHHVP